MSGIFYCVLLHREILYAWTVPVTAVTITILLTDPKERKSELILRCAIVGAWLCSELLPVTFLGLH